MSSVDDRVVKLEFDNKQFETAVSTSMATMEKLKKSLDFSSQSKGLSDLDAAASRFSLGNIGTTIEGASAKFMALATIGITALSQITSKAIATGTALAKSLAIDPIKEGFADYNLKLTSVQTIMNATGKSITEVNKYFSELDTYADKTVFNLSDMTSAFAKFTNAGVDLKTSVPAIKGIANMVALAGQGAGEAQIAFYNLSQSIGKGFLDTMDYKSLNLANVATKEWKDQMVAGAIAAGTLKKVGADSFTIVGAKTKTAYNTATLFNEKLSEGWATTGVLTKVLGDYGDTTTAIGKKAQAAAQNVKSLPMMFDTLKASVGTGWTSSFEIILGNVTESTAMFTDFTNVIQGVLDTWANARNTLLQDWKTLGGRAVAIEAIKNAFAALTSIIRPIKEAFRQIFPAQTGKDLYNLTVAIRDFFAGLKLGADSADKIKRIFAGFFAILSIGKSIISGVIGVVVDLAKSFGGIGGGFLDAAAGIGDFLVKVDQAIKNGALIPFFQTLNKVMAPVNAMIRAIGDAIRSLFDGSAMAAIQAAGDGFGRINDRLSPLKGLLGTLNSVWGKFIDSLANAFPVFANLLDNVKEIFGKIPQAISDSIANGNYQAGLDTINTALLGGIALLIRKFVNGGLKVDVGGGILEKIGGTFDALTGSLKAMETQVKAKALLMIAGAVGILTASVVALSLIDSKKLATALAGMAGIFTELMAGMAVLSKMAGSAGFLKIPLISVSLILLSTAILILTAAVKVLSTMNWGEMMQGLTGLGVLLAMLVVATKPISANAPGLIAASAALILLGVALNIMAAAVMVFGTMDWATMGKGLTGVVGVLTAVAAAMRLMPKNMVLQAAALILIGTALNILAGAVAIFGTMEWGTIGKGLAGIAGALVVIAGAMRLMPGAKMVVTAAGLILVGIALNIIAGAMKIFGSISWDEMARGLTALAGSLALISLAVNSMSGALVGAAALLVVSAALMMLAPVLKILGSMSWEEIGKGLVALAGAFVVIGLAGLALTPVIPQILALGAAVALLGAGIALMGVGVLAFATAITALVAVGSLGIVALTAIMQTVIGIIPMVMKALELALVAFATAIINATPALVEAIVVVFTAIMDGIIRLIPKVLETLGVLLDALLRFIVAYVPKLVLAGYDIIIGLLRGIGKKIPDIIAAGTNIIIQFIKGIGKAALDITKAAGDTLIKFLEGLTKWIRENSDRLNQAGSDLVKAIIDGMVKGVASLGKAAIDAIGGLAGSALDAAKGILGIASPSKEFTKIGQYVVQGFVNGVVSGKDDVVNSMKVIGDALKNAVTNTAADVKSLKEKLKGLKDNKDTKANRDAIKKTEAALKAAEKAHTQAVAANKKFTVGLKAQKAQLVKLGAQYDDVTAKLDAAKQKLAEATKIRDDFAKSITDQYSKLPDIAADTSLDTYFDEIRKSTEANLKFKATLEELRKIGLDDTSYKKFLQQGVDAQPFLDNLLAAGGGAVTELNKIDASLAESATSLGKTASEELYQAGVDSAQGLVDGLNAQMATITAQMKTIGKAMADAIKKELGIKSPSRVFMEVGKFANEGLAKGLDQYSNVVDISAAKVGKTAVESLKGSMTGLTQALGGDIDLQPVIAPVLDLDAFRKDATAINDILAPAAIQPSTSTATAKTISATQQAQADQAAQAQADTAGTVVELTQNNYSPKALTPAEIYRQTKNQLSIVKGVLDKNAV